MYTECETSIVTKLPNHIFCVKHIHLQAECMSHLHDFDNMYRWKSQNVVRLFFFDQDLCTIWMFRKAKLKY